MTGRRFPRWLYPGMHLKRWLALLLAGIVILGLGRGDLHPRPVPDDRGATRSRSSTGSPAPGSSRRSGPRWWPLLGLGADRRRAVGPDALGRLAVRRPRRQRHGGALHEALPGARAADRGDRRRHRPVDAAARAEGVQRQHHRRRGRRRRRRQQRPAPPAARDRAARRHPQLHRRPGRRRAAHDPAHAVPLPGRAPASTTTPSATCSSPP